MALGVREEMELWGWLFPIGGTLHVYTDCLRCKAEIPARLENRMCGAALGRGWSQHSFPTFNTDEGRGWFTRIIIFSVGN